MQKPTLRQNGKKEVTLRVDFHFCLQDLAILVLKQPKYRVQLLEKPGDFEITLESQKLFEKQIRDYLWKYGFIDEDFEFTQEDLNAAINAIKKLYPNHEWE